METICGTDFNTDMFEAMELGIGTTVTDEEIENYDKFDEDFEDDEMDW